MTNLARCSTTGKFLKGGKGGPGRPPKSVEEGYLITLRTTVTMKDWAAVVRRALEDALQGDHQARAWLSKYLIAEPEQADQEWVIIRSYGKEVDRG